MAQFLRHLILQFRHFLYQRGFYEISEPVRNIAGACFLVWILIGLFGLSVGWAISVAVGICIAKEIVDIIVAWPGCWEYFTHNSLPDIGYRMIGILLASIPFLIGRIH